MTTPSPNTKGSKAKTKTANTKKPRNKKDKTQEGGTLSEDSRETKKRTGRGTNRHKEHKSKEPVTAQHDSGKKIKATSKNSKNKKSGGKKDASVDTTETGGAAITMIGLWNRITNQKPASTPAAPTPAAATPAPEPVPSPAAPKKVAKELKDLTIVDDDNTATSKLPVPCTVLPPDPKPAPAAPVAAAPAITPPVRPFPPVLTINPAPTSTEPQIHSPATLNSTISQTEKWIGEEPAKAWLEKVEFFKTKAEFDKLQTMLVTIDECKKWRMNRLLNQAPPDDYPILDANIVSLDNHYVNMSYIDVHLPKNKICVAQYPPKGNEEAFWKAVFDKQISYMTIIVDREPIEFFPLNNGDHIYHGTMFVNNRRVENVNEDIARFAIEVLPEGCSNSIICNIVIIKNWAAESVHSKQAVVVKEVIELNAFLAKTKDENALVVSKHGAGRAGYFIALAAAIFKLDKGHEPTIYEIVKSLRAQRPKLVESLTQYASLYTTLFYFIKKKVGRSDGDKKAVMECEEPICKKTVLLTTAFTNALIQEVAAAAGRSTLTMAPIKQ